MSCQTANVHDQSQVQGDNARHENVQNTYEPRVDLRETKEGVLLVADLPGVAEQDVDVTVENRVLTLKARVSPLPLEGYELVSAEYGTGDFERNFTLSDEIDPEQIEASMANGVLTLRLPKTAKASARKVPIRRAE